MNYLKTNLFLIIFFVSINALTAVKSEADKLLEELTGTTTRNQPKNETRNSNLNKLDNAATLPMSKRHLNAGFKAFTNKNYILALKHYNTVIIKYAKSDDVKEAYLAKAQLYSEIGLNEQAQLNTKLAMQMSDLIK